MYVQYHASKKLDNANQMIVFYALCALYTSSVALIAFDIATTVVGAVSNHEHLLLLDFTLISCAEG
jgi:hypothetical protein